MNELENYIQIYFGIKTEDLERISELFQKTTLLKNDFYCQENKKCNHLSFIKTGTIRVYKYTDKKDVTQWISSGGEFITDLSSLIFDTESRWNIQAITDCELYTIKKEDYNNIGKLIPQWNELEKLFLAKCFLILEDRVFSFLSMTAEERFTFFINQKKELFNQVPHHYIASMLGMTPETLSRIRKKSIS